MFEWIFRIIGIVIPAVTPEIKTDVDNWLDALEAKAKETANPVDDIFVAMLKAIMGR